MNRKMQFFWIMVVVSTLSVKPTVCFRLCLEFGYSFNLQKQYILVMALMWCRFMSVTITKLLKNTTFFFI